MDNFKQFVILSLMIIWCLCSLGIPILAGNYVSWLGTTFRGIKTGGTTKNPHLINGKTGRVIDAKTEFEFNVLDSKNYHYMMGLGPFGFFHSFYYMGISTYNLLVGK